MQSTPFENQIYLGFSSDNKLQQPSIEKTFLGGQPAFLKQPLKGQLNCQNCPKQSLTFMCQVFCPLEVPQCYNRVLYMFYCEKCQREFRCIRQQSSQKQEVICPKLDVRSIKEYAVEIESQAVEVKEFMKMKNKAKRQVEEEIIQEKQAEEFDSEDEDIEVKEIQINFSKLGMSKEEVFEDSIDEEKMNELRVASQTMQQTKKEEKDNIFEVYRKLMSELDGPIIFYSDIPVPYNSEPINPKHFCKYCKSKLSLQLQITQKILSSSPKLVGLDWGNLMVFTCSKSCEQAFEECVVVQYETDAVQDNEIKALKKKHKNKKRKQKNQNTKSQVKGQQKGQSSSENQKEQKEKEEDWD